MVHRIRAAGLLVEDERLLLVHEGVLAKGEPYYIPPGGGLELSDHSLADCLQREFFEEVGIRVVTGEPVYIKEFVELGRQTHHVELFFRVRRDPSRHDTHPAPDRPHVWMSVDELREVVVFPPELKDGEWLAPGPWGACRYLGRTEAALL